MKDIILVINKTNKHIVGAYENLEIAEYEITSNALNKKYDVRNIIVQPITGITDEIYNQMIKKHQRKIIWN